MFLVQPFFKNVFCGCCRQDSLRNLRTRAEGRSRPPLDDELDKLTVVTEDRKPLSVASSEENRAKNRHETALPLDRNRVILTPVPGRDYSTYINASFVEGYDNCESFIVTQDPLEATVRDFWRMVLEHNVAVIVMLSEAGQADKTGILTVAKSIHSDQAVLCSRVKPYEALRDVFFSQASRRRDEYQNNEMWILQSMVEARKDI